MLLYLLSTRGTLGMTFSGWLGPQLIGRRQVLVRLRFRAEFGVGWPCLGDLMGLEGVTGIDSLIGEALEGEC
jgi:hypothetical protein